MPGIYGYAKKSAKEISQICSMKRAMKLYNHFIQDDQFEDDCVTASRVHLGHIGEKSSPYQKGPIFLWIEGEAYNVQDVALELGLSRDTGFAPSLVEVYHKGILDKFLNKLDGFFCAALYDSQAKTIKLISDRYGMRMLYWYHCDGFFAWSSEVKGILSLDGIDKTVDPTSTKCFMQLGYLIGEHTWFEHIKLIKPATIIELNLVSQQVNQHYYWKWSEIKPIALSFDEAVNELGKRFTKAIERRFDPNEKIGISLSGGLDSRAIFAAINHLYSGSKGFAYTFGIPDCDDIAIAKQVVDHTDWQHKIYYFNDQLNWFEQRIENIWNTDGMLDMMHMHGTEFLDDVKQSMYINMNGYAGDAILGGGFLEKVPLDSRITKENSKFFYGNFFDLDSIEDKFYDIDHVEPNLYMNRVRRFTNMGTVNALIKVDQRKPFFDNAVVELVFSLPDAYRLNNKLYSAMLQRFFPIYFKDIPWQKTGKPVAVKRKPTFIMRASRKMKRITLRMLGVTSTNNYTNYPKWIRSKRVAQQLDDLLSRDNSCYSQYIDEDFKQQYLLPHLANGLVNNSNQVLRAATVEIYLRKVRSVEF